MANETTLSAVEETQANIVAVALELLTASIDLTDQRWIRHGMLKSGQSSMSFPVFSKHTAAALTDGNDFPLTQVSTTDATITPALRGLAARATDQANWMTNPESLVQSIARLFADGVRAIRNQDIWTILATFTNSVGANGTNLNEDTIRAGVTTLQDNDAPGPYFMPVTLHQWSDLIGQYDTNANITTQNLRDNALNMGQLAPIFGVTPLLVTNLTDAVKDAANATTAIYSRQAMAYVTRGAEQNGIDRGPTTIVRLDSLELETQRRAIAKALDIVMSSFYGVGKVANQYGVKVLSDNNDSAT